MPRFSVARGENGSPRFSENVKQVFQNDAQPTESNTSSTKIGLEMVEAQPKAHQIRSKILPKRIKYARNPSKKRSEIKKMARNAIQNGPKLIKNGSKLIKNDHIWYKSGPKSLNFGSILIKNVAKCIQFDRNLIKSGPVLLCFDPILARNGSKLDRI